MYFAKNLSRLLTEKGLEQKALAAGIGVSKVSVSNYVNGKATPSAAIQKRIAEFLGCTVADLNQGYDNTKGKISLKNWQELLPEDMLKVPVPLCAKIIGTGEQFLRMALRQGTAPFGFAAETSPNHWEFHISRKQLIKYQIEVENGTSKKIEVEAETK